MTERPAIAFVCAHLCDERLYAAQRAALAASHDCRVFAFRDEDTLEAMAEAVLAAMPPRFALVGLSLGGYVAFEIVRRALARIERLALLDTTAVADTDARRAGRLADIATVEAGGIEALIPQLPGRWLLPAHQQREDLTALMASMARTIGAQGQKNQQRAMLARPDSHADLATIRVPTLVLCGAGDAVTPLADHEAMAARMAGARLVVVPDSGHLSAIEQPAAVTAALSAWLAEPPTRSP